MRRQRNKIHALHDSQGQYIYDCTCIKDAAVEYYQQFFNGDVNTDFPQVDTSMQTNTEGQDYLAPSVTMEEIKVALFSIHEWLCSPSMTQRVQGQTAF